MGMVVNKFMRAIAAAVFLGMLAVAGTASGAPITLTFRGIVTSANQASDIGKSVTGKVVAGGTITDLSDPGAGAYDLEYQTATYSFQVGNAPAFTGTAGMTFALLSPSPGHTAQAGFFVTPASFNIQLAWPGSTQPVSLASFPANETLASAFFGVATLGSGGAYFGPSRGYNFSVSTFAVATTPLPASAWFLVTALGGLGFAGWKRRSPAATTAGAA
jgi:hypothetical protein